MSTIKKRSKCKRDLHLRALWYCFECLTMFETTIRKWWSDIMKQVIMPYLLGCSFFPTRCPHGHINESRKSNPTMERFVCELIIMVKPESPVMPDRSRIIPIFSGTYSQIWIQTPYEVLLKRFLYSYACITESFVSSRRRWRRKVVP